MQHDQLTILVLGGTGATGRLLVAQLLERGHRVRVIVRSPGALPEAVKGHQDLTVIHGALLELSDGELAGHVNGCDAVASCLGHNLSFKGIWGQPRRLVTDATRRLCAAIRANQAGQASQAVKFVLMNTTGNRNRDLDERTSLAEKSVIGLLRCLVPPHPDNEQAAEFLRTEVGQADDAIEWCAVRPDALINQDQVTGYQIHPSPIRSAIFNAGKASRIHVAHFMAELITNKATWAAWKGRMPVIYND